MSQTHNTSWVRHPAWAFTQRGYALFSMLRQMARTRNATLYTLFVLAITMTLPALVLFLSDDLRKLPTRATQAPSITAYLNNRIDSLAGAEIAARIEARSEVERIEYISSAQALEEFSAHSEFADVLSVLDDNPLPGAVVVYPKNAYVNKQSMSLLAQQLESDDAVERVHVDLLWVERLGAMVALVKLILLLLSALLVITTLAVIANTLRLEMLQRRKEADVAELLGAPRSFVRRPYLYLGASYGVIGGLLACFAATLLLLVINPAIATLARAYGGQFQLSLPNLSQAGVLILSGLALGLLAALLSLNSYTRSRKTVI